MTLKSEAIAPRPAGDRNRLLQAAAYAANPLHWPLLIQRIWRNPEFFTDLLEYANAVS